MPRGTSCGILELYVLFHPFPSCSISFLFAQVHSASDVVCWFQVCFAIYLLTDLKSSRDPTVLQTARTNAIRLIFNQTFPRAPGQVNVADTLHVDPDTKVAGRHFAMTIALMKLTDTSSRGSLFNGVSSVLTASHAVCLHYFIK